MKRAAAIAFATLWLALGAVAAPGGKSQGDDVHRQDADCSTCHTADAATLARDPGAARQLLATDLERRCNVCHGDEGPSHPTSVRAGKGVPDILPLAGDGTIGCATCHFMHGENNRFGDFLRIDNREGALCLTCHRLSELE